MLVMARRKNKEKIKKERKEITETKIFEHFDDFIDYLKRIEPLILFSTIFIALFTLLLDRNVPEAYTFIANRTKIGILLMLFFLWFFLIVYWMYGNKKKYGKNLIIPFFLGFFGSITAGSVLWLSELVEKQSTFPYIPEFCFFGPMFIFVIVTFVNYYKLVKEVGKKYPIKK